ncbi:MAG: rubrerythrin family protein [Desulfobulbaceae bacterium]|uniref:Rubrerythrin family protein n=1 Tax=Candidatus Desulfatifera sulfidica TaxID=2841691 RepID=A0A8J6N7J7_9BACT|nr:rubrerythrin family protein [Candidatus Desulfatifera sulfidica]
MSSIKGTQTEKNILTAFAGESQARNRYMFFAKQAKKEGFVQISAIFERTAGQEQAHAKTLFNFLEGGDVEITAAYPAGMIGTTLENLQAAAAGERHEHEHMYPEFAEVADAEGFPAIAATMRAIGLAEKQHDRAYSAFIDNIEKERVFKTEGVATWYCIKCGYRHEGNAPPEKCPACAHPQGYYELLSENW